MKGFALGLALKQRRKTTQINTTVFVACQLMLQLCRLEEITTENNTWTFTSYMYTCINV